MKWLIGGMEREEARKKGRRSKAEAEGLVREYEKSGLSRKAFSAGHELSVHTLDVYRKRLRGKPGEGGVANRLVAVEISKPLEASGGELTVALSNGRRIEVKRGFDGDTLERLMALLERA
jgi:hypothetical protein